MTNNKAEYIFIENELSLDDFIRLKEEAFGMPCPKGTALASLKGSRYLLHIELNDEVIGMARVVGDGGFVNYLADVIVTTDHQGKGIGRLIMERIIKYAESSLPKGGRSLVCLFAAKSKEPFYEKFGFKSRPDERFGAGMQMWLKSESE